MDKMGYPKLELGLSAMTKDQLADNIAYNSLKFAHFEFTFDTFCYSELFL
jgi:hypothetical protein